MAETNAQRVALSFGDYSKLRPYEEAVRAVGLEPVLNPQSLDGVAGLVLAGGTDVDPQLYGEQKHLLTEDPDPDRDQRELRLIQQATALDLPVLAICRGLQMLNVALGGTLIQHLPDAHRHVRRTPDPSEGVHEITVSRGSRLAAAVGAGEHSVNSRHHQAIGRLASGLRVVATSTQDGVIEAVELGDKRYVVGVQWHPEDRIQCESDRKLFAAFAQSVMGANLVTR